MTKVLLVEDDPSLAGLMARFLRGRGHDVLSAKDGVEGLTLARTHDDIEVIVADLMMPRIDGDEFLMELRRTSGERCPRFILATASTLREEVAARTGADASLEKPFDLDELDELIRELSAR